MLNHLRLVFLSVFVLTLAACQVPPDVGARITETLDRVATTLDRDADGIITNREVKDSTNPNNPMNWVALIGGILGLIGVAKSQNASSGVKIANARIDKTKSEVDGLWDVTHQPIAATKV